MGKIKQELVTFGKAELTASIASIVDFGLAFFLSDIIGIYYGLANALGVMSGGITNCTLNYRYVFGYSKRKKKSVAWRYFIIWALSWTLNSGGTIALTEAINLHEHVNIHYMIPKMCGFISCSCAGELSRTEENSCLRKRTKKRFLKEGILKTSNKKGKRILGNYK